MRPGSVRSQRSSAAAAFPARNRARTTSISRFYPSASCRLRLSWASVRRSWPRYRSAFLNFEIAKLAHADPAALLRRPGALRNPKKVAALVANAQEFERIREEHGTFGRYLRTVKSGEDACAMLQERFRHVGPYTAEFYLHCVGRSVYGS